jgi:hypothetical protein
LLGLIGLFLPASGQASLITWDFTGTLMGISPERPGHDFGGIMTKPVGPHERSRVAGRITFDPHTVDSNPDPHIGQFNNAIKDISYTVTTIWQPGDPYRFGLDPNPSQLAHPDLWPRGTYVPTPRNSIQINADPLTGNQAFRLEVSVRNVSPPTGIAPFPGDPGYLAREFWIDLIRPSQGVFTTDALGGTPPPPPSLFALYDAVTNHNGQFRLGFRSGHDAPILSGDLTSLVPLPAAVYLFGTGVIGLVGFARRRAA